MRSKTPLHLVACLVPFTALIALSACEGGGPVDVDGGGVGLPDAGGLSAHDGGQNGDPDAGTAGPTWHRDVLPVVQRTCLGCHLEGGVAPFPLETFAQAKAMHLGVADAVAQRRMPPWMPDPECRTYKHQRLLTQAEIDTFVAWSAAGAPEGDPADGPGEPPAPAALPWVSDTLDPGVDYTPSTASGPDDYHCFILDPQREQPADVIGFDIVPGVHRMVHHVLLYSAARTDAQAQDARHPGPGWKCFGGPGTANPQVVGGWVPGTPVTQYPEGTGIRVEPDAVLVMQVHYNTSTGGAEPDRTRVRLQYARQPVPKLAQILPQAHATFAIPPQSTNYEVTTTENTQHPGVTVWGVLPHMHQLGKRIRVEVAETGTCLVDIPRWDFHWQQFYMFEEPLQVAPDHGRTMTCAWDNPTSQWVRWGEGTGDEMCLNYVYVTVP